MGGAATSSPKLYHGIRLKNKSIGNRGTPQLTDNLLTPKADHYKNLVDLYKKTLAGLNVADHKNDAVK
jgi:hypothetical protein